MSIVHTEIKAWELFSVIDWRFTARRKYVFVTFFYMMNAKYILYIIVYLLNRFINLFFQFKYKKYYISRPEKIVTLLTEKILAIIGGNPQNQLLKKILIPSLIQRKFTFHQTLTRSFREKINKNNDNIVINISKL